MSARVSGETSDAESGADAAAPASGEIATGAGTAVVDDRSWRQVLADAAGGLHEAHEARFIVQHVAAVSSAELLGHLDETAPPALAAEIGALVERRCAGEPLQWVLGEWGFRGLHVAVDGRALVPRPETETVVETALAELNLAGAPFRVADLGTGSGVIALSIAAERRGVQVFATDASPKALSLAAENLGRLEEDARSRVHLLRGDWWAALPARLAGSFAVVVSNPPYLSTDEWTGLDPVVREYDPYDALVAGPSGLEVISLLVAEAPGWLHTAGALVVEIAPHQARAVLDLARAGGSYASAEVFDDLAGRPRVLVARRAA